MTVEEMQKKYDQLLDKVRRMRGHQKEYFTYRSGSALKMAKHWEREVDKLIEEEVKRKKSGQQDLL